MTRLIHRQKRIFAVCLVGLGVLTATVFWHQAMKEKDEVVTLGALLSQYPMPVSVAPHGSRVLLKTCHASDFELAVLDLTSGKILNQSRSPDTQLSLSWRPDGEAIAFISSTAGNRQYRLSLWSPSTGELNTFDSPLTFTAAPPIRWSPDGRSLLLYVGDGRAGELTLVKWGTTRVLETVPLARVSPEADYRWSEDGGRIAYIPAENEGSIQQLDVHSSRAPELLAQLPAGSQVRDLSWSADGQSLLFSAREPGEEFFSLRLLDLRTRQSRWVARRSSDLRHPIFLKGQEHFLYEANEGGVNQLWMGSTEGTAHKLLGPPDESHLILGLSEKDDQVYTVRSRMESPPDLVAVSPFSGEFHIIAESPKQAVGIRPRLLTVKSQDGLDVPVMVWTGNSPEPGAKRRAVINVHGGPHLQELPLWDARTQYLLRQGLIFVSVNYRGSRGYGAGFEVHEDGVGQAQDVLAVQRYLTQELGVPAENISLLASSTGTRVAVHAAALEPAAFGSLVLTSTISLTAGICPRELGSRRILAFHGGSDSVLSPSSARETLNRCFGAGNIQFKVFVGEGHQFHRSQSWAEIMCALK